MTLAKVWVVYCAEDQQYAIHLPFQQGMTAAQALAQSQLAQKVALPEPLQLGVFGLKIKDPEHYLLNAGDRLEIYRPLKMNPKDVRRKRAEQHPVGRFSRGNQWRKQQKTTE